MKTFNKTLNAGSIFLALGLAGVQNAFAASYADAGTDYSNASTNEHIWTPGVEALDTVNNILCFVGQLKLSEMVNKGMYTALVDEKKCAVGGNSDGRDKGPSQQFVIVETVRKNDSSPQYAKVWIPGMSIGENTTGTIKAFASISKQPTETDPLQDFALRYDMYTDANVKVGGGQIVATPSSQLAGGKIGLKYYEEMSDGQNSRVSAANIIKNPDGSDGVAITTSPVWDDAQQMEVQKSFGVSWNQATEANRVLIKRGTDATNNSDLQGTETCLAKDNLKAAVWRYGVYYKDGVNAGKEVQLNSGFPIVYTENNEEKNGYVGYWGLWTDSGNMPSGAVYKVNYDVNPPTKTAVNISQAPGKLWKNQLKEMTLADIGGVKFEFWDSQGTAEVEYDANGVSGAGFYKTGTITYGNNGPQVTSQTPALIDLSGVGNRLYLWSQQLGGQVSIPVASGSLVNKVFVAVRSLVTPNDGMFDANGNAALTCYDRCPKANISLQDANTWNGPFLGTGANYSFSSSDMTLKTGGVAVKFADGITQSQLQQTQFSSGVQSGVLVTADVATAITNGTVNLYDGTLTTWYEWETGLESWNQYTMVSQNGTPITFDEPLKFVLNFDANTMARQNSDGTVPTAMQAYNGQAYLLEYGGNGELWGFPNVDAGDNRYYPAIALKDGATISSNGQDYVVKAWDVEKKMAEDVNGCSNLVLENVPGGLPTEINTNLPVNSDATPTNLPEAPSVVNGVIQVTN